MPTWAAGGEHLQRDKGVGLVYFPSMAERSFLLWVGVACLGAAGCKDDPAAPASAASAARQVQFNEGVAVLNPVNGRPQADHLTGTSTDDIIDAMAGNDTVFAGAGDDYVLGGEGDDLIYGDAEPAAADNAPPVPNPAPPGADHHPADRGWGLVWSDEFDGDALDPQKWAPEVSCWGGGNSERQCYTDREENVQVVNGLLRLVARAETFTGPSYPPEWNDPTPENTQDYTSGKIRTRDLADWTYGRFEIRAKMPQGQGMWPALWMLPAEDFYGTWPLSGEIDIMEAVNLGAFCNSCTGEVGENRTSAALHFGDAWPANQSVSQKVELPDGANPADDYHVWAVEWGEGRMHFFFNDVKFYSVYNFQWYTAAVDSATNPNAPFDRPFYLMANVAVGGNWPENVNSLGIAEDAVPNEMLVDWVRVYQCTDDIATGLACMDN